MAERALEGRLIVVTRPREQAEPFAAALERVGAAVRVLPLVRIEPLADTSELAAALADLGRYDWLVVTSTNGVEALRPFVRTLEGVKIAAVGPATAAALHELGAAPAFVPERHAGEEIEAGLGPLEGARILLPQADIADPALADALRSRGAIVDAVTAYRTVADERSSAELAELRGADAVVLASGSAARSLAAQGGAGGALVACIGPKTADMAREVGLGVGLVSREATSEGIIHALTSHFGENE